MNKPQVSLDESRIHDFYAVEEDTEITASLNETGIEVI